LQFKRTKKPRTFPDLEPEMCPFDPAQEIVLQVQSGNNLDERNYNPNKLIAFVGPTTL
jgi:hypothetical protein